MSLPTPGMGKTIFGIIILGVIGTAFCGMALYFIGNFYWEKYEWNDVDATVTYSNAEYTGTSKNGDRYAAFVDYTYTVAGKEYQGGYQSISTNIDSYINNILTRYQKGTVISIKVNPKNPEDSMIPENDTWFYYIFLAVGVIMYGLIILLLRRVKVGGSTI